MRCRFYYELLNYVICVVHNTIVVFENGDARKWKKVSSRRGSCKNLGCCRTSYPAFITSPQWVPSSIHEAPSESPLTGGHHSRLGPRSARQVYIFRRSDFQPKNIVIELVWNVDTRVLTWARQQQSNMLSAGGVRALYIRYVNIRKQTADSNDTRISQYNIILYSHRRCVIDTKHT